MLSTEENLRYFIDERTIQLERGSRWNGLRPFYRRQPIMQTNEKTNHTSTPLRVGLLLDSICLPLWAQDAIHHLKSSPAVEIAALFLDADCREDNPLDPAEQGWNRAFYRAFCQFDKNKFLESPDVLERSDVSELTREWPLHKIRLLRNGQGFTFSSADLNRIRDQQLDVLLFLGEKDRWGDIPRLARHGLWAFQFGSQQPPAFWEVVEGIPTIPSGLYICADEEAEERLIYASVAPGDNISPAVIRNHIYQKSAQFPVRKLEQLYHFGDRALDPEFCPAPEGVLPSPRREGIPGNLQMTLAFSRLIGGFIKDVYKRKVDMEARWDIAFRFGGDRLDISNLQVISPPKGGFWADPFPWQHEGRYYIFFEELMFSDKKGVLRVMEVKRDGSWSDPVTILEKDYHLSYPFLFEWEGDLYMLPETMQNGTIEVYRCVSFPDKWELHKVLMEGIKAVDATLLQRDGRWWMFVSMAVNNGEAWDEVSLFYADNPFGPWTPHPCNPVRSDVRSARPAGWLFERDGRLYRPAQDCSVCYGHALSINEVIRLDTERYEEKEVKRILPRPELNEMGIHTVNQAGDLIVFDRFAAETKTPRLP